MGLSIINYVKQLDKRRSTKAWALTEEDTKEYFESLAYVGLNLMNIGFNSFV